MKTVILHDGILKDVTPDLRYEVVDTSTLEVKPCYNCRKCQSEGSGLCKHTDDVGIALHAIGNAQRMILVSELWYGSYSPNIKKVLDKLMLLGRNSYFQIQNGKLAHEKGNVPIQEWIALAYKDQFTQEEEQIFHALVSENADITGCAYHASYVVEKSKLLQTYDPLLGVTV